MKETFSYSKLDRYCTCPRSYYLKYIARIPEKPSKATMLGQAVHAVLAVIQEIYDKTGVVSLWIADLLSQPLGKAYRVEPAEIASLVSQPAVNEEIEKGGQAEEHFQVELQPGIVLEGYIELWRDNGERIEVIDWKTGRNIYFPCETRQLPLHAYHLWRETGKPVTGKLVFLACGKVFEEEIGRSQIEEATEWAVTTAQEILQKKQQLQEIPADVLFPANPSQVCSNCGYAELCTGEAAPCEQPRDYDEAVKLAAEIVQLEAVLKNKKEALYQYIDGTGINVPVGSKEFRLIGEGYWKWTPEAIRNVYRYALEKGVDPFRYFSFTATGAQKLGLTEEQIRAFGAEWKKKKPALRLVKKEDTDGN